MAVDDDPRWPLPVDHPSALPEAIGRVAMSSAMLECTLRNVIEPVFKLSTFMADSQVPDPPGS